MASNNNNTGDDNEAQPEASPKSKEENDSSESSSDEEDEDLVLEGVIVRNPDVPDSEDESTSSEEEEEEKPAAAAILDKKRPSISQDTNKDMDDGKDSSKKQKFSKKKSKTKKPASSGPEIIPVEFTFCDMHERYFHGLKTLLTSSSPVYATLSSALADLMIENVAVGTVISTEADKEEGNIYGYASVLNVTTYQDQACIQELKKLCLDKCPAAHKAQLATVLSGKTKRPAGFYLQSRMVNLPLEIVEVLHQQLVLDMDWAVENAEGGEDERKSLNFGAFVRIAPSYRSGATSFFKYFDDEIFAQHAEFSYEIALPKTFETEETPYCTVVVMTKIGHRDAMKALSEMVHGAETVN
jgi:hypothetical protein